VIKLTPLNFASIDGVIGRCAQITLKSGKILFVKVIEANYAEKQLVVYDDEMLKRKIAFEEILYIKKAGEHICESRLLNGLRFRLKKEDK
jgi:hypothetical protein